MAQQALLGGGSGIESGSSSIVEIVDEVKNYLKQLDVFDEIYETRAGGVISSHCGPGTLGVLFIAGE